MLEENTVGLCYSAYTGKQTEVLAKVLFGHIVPRSFLKVMTHMGFSAVVERVPGLGLPCTAASCLD